MAQVINKYVWLVETIRRAGSNGITLEEINEEWLRKDNQEMSGGVDIPNRTFHKWRNAIEKLFNVAIVCNRKGGYHYVIANPEELDGHGMSNWLLDTVSVSNLLMQNIAIKDRILLESIPSGLNFLPDILDAMNGNKVLSIKYEGFLFSQPKQYDVHPYCVKLFKQRWYMVAYSVLRQGIRIYSVDRIKAIKQQSATFKIAENFDPATFFSNAYGVMIGNLAPQDIKIKVQAFQANYLRSLPLHKSQLEVFKTREYSLFTYHLCPEFDFMMELLSLGNTVEVLEPASLRNEIAECIQSMNNIYNPTSGT